MACNRPVIITFDPPTGFPSWNHLPTTSQNRVDGEAQGYWVVGIGEQEVHDADVVVGKVDAVLAVNRHPTRTATAYPC